MMEQTYAELVPSFSTLSDNSLNDLNWMSTLSPKRRSCINLSSVEPCVNKVVSHLDHLKTQIDECNQLFKELALKAKQDVQNLQDTDTRSASPRSILVNREQGISSAAGSGRTSRLVIEGVTTGISVERHKMKKDKLVEPDRLDGNEVISAAIKLVARLEQDRQETLDNLANEKNRVETLGRTLDIECERRLNLLPAVVQAEHDECLRDMLELKWHVNFDKRQLSRVKDDLRLTTLKNDKLKQSVDYYKENCPLLEEKLVIENGHMSEISRGQQETSDKLSQAKHLLSQTEDKSARANKRANKERENMENILDECKMTLVMSESELKEAVADTTALTHQMNDCHAKISENKRQMKKLDDKTATTKGYQSQVETRVSLLRDSYTSMEREHLRLEQKLQRLNEKKQSEHDSLEAEHVLLNAEMQKEDHTLREARDCNDDLEHSIDTLKENIALFNKQTHDDEKSVERARRELVKLDEQMGVSVAQFTKVRDEHFHLSEQLKTDEAKAGNIEHSLRTKLEALQQQIKDEGRTKMMYDGKVQAGSAELDKLKAECKKQADKVYRLAQESEKQSTGQTDVVTKLEGGRDERSSLLESLKSQLSSVQTEHASVEKELSEIISLLTPQEKQLTEEMQAKISRVDIVTERIKLLQRKIEDVVKSTAMLDKMEVSTTATIDQLENQLSLTKEKLAAEKEEEQRCRQEYKEIAEFSSDADEKHKEYLKKRAELLTQCKVDLFKAHSTNSTLASDYQKLQYEFISAKTLALRVLERKLDMEASLRDHKQAYYEHRGSQCWKKVTHYYKESKNNAHQLKRLQNQFRTVIELMHDFLEQDS